MEQLPDHVRIPLASSTTSDYRELAQEADRLCIAGNLSLNTASLRCEKIDALPEVDSSVGITDDLVLPHRSAVQPARSMLN